MNKNRNFVSCIASIIGVAVIAGPAMAANAFSVELVVEGVISNPAGGFLLLLPASNPACGSSGNQFNVTVGVNGMTADGAKAALAVSLTAMAMGKRISVVFDGAIPGCPVQQVFLKP